jgi:glutathione synthase/RimK-type ligase-like ATP-grasp enzyme
MPKPDPETHLLVAALAELDIDAVVTPWDADLDWAGFPLVLVRSPWDYFERLNEFLGWARRVAALTRLVNPCPVIEWNAHKRYLGELAAQGLPVVPTLWLDQGSTDSAARLAAAPWQQLVIKPAVSIGAINTLRGDRDDPASRQHIDALLPSGDVMVQPYLPDIASAGEVSLVFFSGTFSHAIRKVPRPGDYRVQDMYGGTVHPHTPSAAEIELATNALRLTPAPTTYARVDLVRHEGRQLIMELELIEPELFLPAAPDAARRFAAALHAQLCT